MAIPRIVHLIKRDAQGRDRITLDVAGPALGTQGVLLGEGSLEAMHHATRSSTSDTTAFMPGSLPGLDRVEERIYTLILRTEETDSQSWEYSDDLLWEVIAPSQFFTMKIETKAGTGHFRETQLRRVLAPQLLSKKTDSGDTRSALWQVQVTAHDPWFYGPEFTHRIRRGDDMTYDPGLGEWVGQIPVLNRGDQYTFPEFACNENTTTEQWTLPDAPGLLYPAGHPKAGQQVMHTLPELGPGKEFWVQTHPLMETLQVRADTQEWAKMRAEDFEFWLEPRTTIMHLPVRLKGGTDDSELTVYIAQPYERPYGR